MEKSDFYCTQCGNIGIPVWRTRDLRESGHLKDLYCIFCKEVASHAEVRTSGSYTHDHFRIEFENGNFDAKGRRIDPYWRHFVSVTMQTLHSGRSLADE